MSENPYDPNINPDKYMAWYFSENRRRYLKRFPEEKRVQCFETAGFHRPLNKPTGRATPKKTRRG